jgi:DNA-binding phage protein
MVEQVVIDISGESEGPSLEEQGAAMDAEMEPQYDESRPEWLPEKFNSAEDMAQAYHELEGRLGSNEAESQEEEIREDLENWGVDYDALSQEFWGNGDLSEDSYDQLEQAGIPRSIVDSYIEAQLNMVDTQRSGVMAEVGGQAGYEQLTDWAADNLEEAEIDYFNTVMDTNDFQAIQMAVRAVAARRDASEGMEPSRNLSGSLTGGGGGTYESVQQLMTDMQNPSYQNDSAFRSKVEAKLGRSNIM